MPLITTPNFSEPGKHDVRAFSPGDDFYEALLDMHRDLDDERSVLINARLVLLLAEHIGALAALREAMKLAREGVQPPAQLRNAGRYRPGRTAP